MFIVTSLDEARAAIIKVAAARRTSLTAMSDAAGIARGVITRFANAMGQRQSSEPDIRLSSVIRYLEHAGYEIRIVAKDSRTSRQRLLDAARGSIEDAA